MRHAPPTRLSYEQRRGREGGGRAEEGSHGRAVGGGRGGVEFLASRELSDSGGEKERGGHEITRVQLDGWKNPDGCFLCVFWKGL